MPEAKKERPITLSWDFTARALRRETSLICESIKRRDVIEQHQLLFMRKLPIRQPLHQRGARIQLSRTLIRSRSTILQCLNYTQLYLPNIMVAL